MASNARVSVFTPASVAKFTNGAYIRGAFSPRAVAAMPATVRLKPEFIGPDSTINKEELAKAICVKPSNIAQFIELSPDAATLKKQALASCGYDFRMEDPNPGQALRAGESRLSDIGDFTGRMLLGRIGVPEDVLEPVNIVSVLKGDICSFQGNFSLSVKEGSSYDDAWNGLTAAYIGHMDYDPIDAGTALGSIASSMSRGSNCNRMPRTFLTNVAQLLYPEDKKSTAQVLVAALQRTNPADESAQIRAVTETSDRDIINLASNNWNDWRLKPGNEASMNTAVATSFASVLKGDLQLSNIISNALSINAKDFASREGFSAELVNIVKGLDISLSEKIDLFIKIAAQVKADQSLPEHYRTVIPEEFIRELLVS